MRAVASPLGCTQSSSRCGAGHQRPLANARARSRWMTRRAVPPMLSSNLATPWLSTGSETGPERSNSIGRSHLRGQHRCSRRSKDLYRH